MQRWCVDILKRYDTSSYGDRTFAAVGPRLWNSLPVQLRNPDITDGTFFGKNEHGAL